jgi:hypothetical protein
LRAQVTDRLQCDENRPECTQCVSRGLKCPGPTVGTVFVTVKPNAKRPVVAKEDRNSSLQNLPVSSTDAKHGHTAGTSGIVNTHSTDGNQLPSGLHAQFLLPAVYQPSRMAPFQELFLSHFISSFNNQSLHRTAMKSWYEELPEILSKSRYQAGIASIRAATMVHYGVVTVNVSIQTAAYRWYAKALQGQRTFLQKGRLVLSRTMPTAEEILSPVVLTLFELVSSTTPTGWIEHILGSATMLQLRKPENCQTGLAHLLFRSLRVSVVSLDGILLNIRA